MTDRRAVRVLPALFILLDEQLPHERGPHGEPTAAEFAASDLLDIVDTFATSYLHRSPAAPTTGSRS